MLFTVLALSLIAISLLWSSCYHATIYLASMRAKRYCVSNGDSIAARLSVVIPAKNEPIEVLVRSLRSFVDNARDIRAEAVLVLDDPIDRVHEVLKKLCRVIHSENVVVVARLAGRHGRNGAIVDGMMLSLGEKLMVIDADCIIDKEVLREASLCESVCIARWKPYVVYSTFVEEAMAFLTDYGSWLLYRRRNAAGLFLYPLGAGTTLTRDLAQRLGYWPRDAIQDDIRLGTILAKLGIEPVLLCSRIWVSVPPTLDAVRVQQSRWAFGTCDVLRRFGKLVILSDMPLRKRIEAYFYMMQPLASIPGVAGFGLGVAAALIESNLPLFGDMQTSLCIAAIALSMAIESIIVLRFVEEEKWSRERALFLMGRMSAIMTLVSLAVAVYSLLGLIGVRLPYRITPKSFEKRNIPDVTVLAMLGIALATLIPSTLNMNVPIALLGLSELAVAIYALKRLV